MTVKFDQPGQLKRIAAVFTPESPIKTREFFIGRIQVIADCLSVVERPGAHIALYGNRGVGKTSLATILKPLCGSGIDFPIQFTNCDSVDTFESLWRKTFEDVVIDSTIDLPDGESQSEPALPEDIYKTLGTKEILSVFQSMGGSAVVIFDEFDRLNPKFDRRLFADTVKAISDSLPNVTLVIVGVGKNITELIGEHASVERNLIQIPLPEMSPPELRELITKGLELLDMSMDKRLIDKIVEFSCGYPYFTHLMSLHACRSAVLRNRMSVLYDPDFRRAIASAIRQSLESLRLAYTLATGANRESFYEQVLWAVALAVQDENQTFQAKDLLAPLSKILHKPDVKYQSFIGHLSAFCSDDRGSILEKSGKQRRVRYKLKDPRMRAFILMKYQESVRERTSNGQEELPFE